LGRELPNQLYPSDLRLPAWRKRINLETGGGRGHKEIGKKKTPAPWAETTWVWTIEKKGGGGWKKTTTANQGNLSEDNHQIKPQREHRHLRGRVKSPCPAASRLYEQKSQAEEEVISSENILQHAKGGRTKSPPASKTNGTGLQSKRKWPESSI